MVEEGKLDDYERRLRDLVDVNGEIYHFEYLNSVTRDNGQNFSTVHTIIRKLVRLLRSSLWETLMSRDRRTSEW